MDISKYVKQKNLWIFEETFPEETLGIFICAKEWLTNGGKKADVFVLSIEGNDYMIMPFNLDYTDFVEKLGNETEKWNNKNFALTKNKKGKYVIRLIEDNI